MTAITHDDANAAVGLLIGSTPGPWTEFQVQVYTDEFMTLTGSFAAEALHNVATDMVRNWTELFRPSPGEVLDRWHREHMRLMEGYTISDRRRHCDGSGWVERDGVMRPCRRCNPALAAVYDDPDKLARWRTGTALTKLDVGVERVKGVMRFTDGRDPLTCERDPHEMPVADVTVARRLMWSGYEAQCDDDGREANREHFAKWVPVPVEVPVTVPAAPEPDGVAG